MLYGSNNYETKAFEMCFDLGEVKIVGEHCSRWINE